MCVRSSVWAKREGLGERLESQEAAPGISSLDPEFLGRGAALPSHPRVREGPNFPSQLLAQTLGLPITARCVPAAGFSQLLCTPFTLSASSSGNPPFSHPASGIPLGG